MTDELERLLDGLRAKSTFSCEALVETGECASHGDYYACLLASVDAIEAEVRAHYVELPVRIKERQAIERENSKLYGFLNDMQASRDAEREKRIRAQSQRNAHMRHEGELVDLLRDARDEYVEMGEAYRRERGKRMAHFIGGAVVGAVVGFFAFSIVSVGRNR